MCICKQFVCFASYLKRADGFWLNSFSLVSSQHISLIIYACNRELFQYTCPRTTTYMYISVSMCECVCMCAYDNPIKRDIRKQRVERGCPCHESSMEEHKDWYKYHWFYSMNKHYTTQISKDLTLKPTIVSPMSHI